VRLQVFLHWRLQTRRHISPAAHALRAALMQQRSARRLASRTLSAWLEWAAGCGAQQALALRWASAQQRRGLLGRALGEWYR
jgi:hypothetical protein